jgi:antitoxin HicB
MATYIAVIHKDPDSIFGASFPDVPGVVAAADTLDAAMAEAAEVLSFAAEDWQEQTGVPFPAPRSLDALRGDAAFRKGSEGAVVAAIPLVQAVGRAA